MQLNDKKKKSLIGLLSFSTFFYLTPTCVIIRIEVYAIT